VKDCMLASMRLFDCRSNWKRQRMHKSDYLFADAARISSQHWIDEFLEYCLVVRYLKKCEMEK
jgi:hypothetical protein